MNTLRKITILGLFGIFAIIPLTACDSGDGKAEEMGEDIDEAVEDVGEGLEDAADEVGETLEDAGDEIQN